jgi:hypothetical protein
MDDELYTASGFGRRMCPPVTGARVRQLVKEGRLQVLRSVDGVSLIPRAELIRINHERALRAAAGIAARVAE